MASLSPLHRIAPLALALAGCSLHRSLHPPWQLRSGAVETAVDATARDPFVRSAPSAEDASFPAAGARETPKSENAEWHESERIALQAMMGATLSGPDGTELGRVADLLVDPASARVAGVLIAPLEGDREPPVFLPFEGLLEHEGAVLTVSSSAATELAVDRRELATAALFRGREVESYEGTVSDIDLLTAEEDYRVFTLTDDQNHRHRVLFAPLSLTKAVPLEAGERVRLEALSTRDEAGPLLVPSWIGIGDFELRLRDQQGRATWSRETPRGLRFAELRGRPVQLAGQPVGSVLGLTARFSDGKIETVRIALDRGDAGEGEVDLPWEDLKGGGGGELEVDAVAWEGALAPAG